MRKLLIGSSLIITLAFAGVGSAADGLVDLSWDGCTGPVDVTPPPTTLDLFVTVTGIDQGHKAYDVRVWYGNEQQEVPDAWRFDADGCQAGRIRQDVSVARTCAAFMQAGAGNLQIRWVEFSPDWDAFATTLMRILLANTYAPVTSVDPKTTYLLERVRFDLGAAVPGAGDPPTTCGGLDQTICFKLFYATYLDLDGNEIPFGRTRFVPLVTVNGPGACSAIPVRPTTWGGIKSQYRQ